MNILCKLLSGRFILTVISGITFSVLAIKGILPVDNVMQILLLVFALYFSKNRETPTEK